MHECSKAVVRRMREANFMRRYFVGAGIDIGGRPDPLEIYAEFFPFIASVRTWDLEDGDAQTMAGVADESFDFVHSSHCLEHLVDPAAGLASWWRILKSGGFLVITVPDEDLYEQGVWPAAFNRDHKWTFTIMKPRSWSEKSIQVVDLVRGLGEGADLERLVLLDDTWRRGLTRYDQSLSPVSECGIEFVVRKRGAEEIARGGRPLAGEQPKGALRRHLNQYRDDMATLKRANVTRPPFENDDPL